MAKKTRNPTWQSDVLIWKQPSCFLKMWIDSSTIGSWFGSPRQALDVWNEAHGFVEVDVFFPTISTIILRGDFGSAVQVSANPSLANVFWNTQLTAQPFFLFTIWLYISVFVWPIYLNLFANSNLFRINHDKSQSWWATSKISENKNSDFENRCLFAWVKPHESPAHCGESFDLLDWETWSSKRHSSRDLLSGHGPPMKGKSPGESTHFLRPRQSTNFLDEFSKATCVCFCCELPKFNHGSTYVFLIGTAEVDLSSRVNSWLWDVVVPGLKHWGSHKAV